MHSSKTFEKSVTFERYTDSRLLNYRCASVASLHCQSLPLPSPPPSTIDRHAMRDATHHQAGKARQSRQTTFRFRRDDLVCSISHAQGGLPGLPLCHLCALSNFQLVHPDGSKLHARPPCKSCNQTRSMQRRPSPPLSLLPRYGGHSMTQDRDRGP